MTIAIIDVSKQSASTLTVTKPTGAGAGAVGVAVCRDLSTDPFPSWTVSGWTTQIYFQKRGGSQSITGAILTRVFDGSEGSSINFTPSEGDGGTIGAILTAYSGVDNTTPWDTGTAEPQSGAEGSSLTWTGFTTASAGELLIFAFLGDGQKLLATPSGALTLTTRVDGTTDAAVWGYYDAIKSTAGATGDYTASFASSDAWLTMFGSLKAAPPPANQNSIFFGSGTTG